VPWRREDRGAHRSALRTARPAQRGLAEIYKTYTTAYDRRSGGTAEVTVQILRNPEGAWAVRVRSEGGKVAASNFSSNLEAALAMVHWECLG
jgi:hypothetical protein